MPPFNKKRKLTAQFILGTIMILAAITLLFMGFWVAPIGYISANILIAFGEACTFASALIGVDYSYRFKVYETNERYRFKNLRAKAKLNDFEENEDYNYEEQEMEDDF